MQSAFFKRCLLAAKTDVQRVIKYVW